MSEKETSIEIKWTGPYGWPGFESENELPSIPGIPGIYLWTFEYKDGYVIYVDTIGQQRIFQWIICFEEGSKNPTKESELFHRLDLNYQQNGSEFFIRNGFTKIGFINGLDYENWLA